jgi:hypothetical protein
MRSASDMAYTACPSDLHTRKVLLDVIGVLDIGNGLVVHAFDRRITMRTTCHLHGHTALANCRRVAVLAQVSVARSTEPHLHSGYDHPYLTLLINHVCFAQRRTISTMS